MRKIVASLYLSLDGVMEEPNWIAPYWDDEIASFKLDELFSSGALLLGRLTYEGFAVAWPARSDEASFAYRMNSLPKYIVSTTLQITDWNNSKLIKENVHEEVFRLKQEPGQDILIYGSGLLVDSLAQEDLIDEYRLLVYPLVLGKGKRLFKYGQQAGLKLSETKTFITGVVYLRYSPDRKAQASPESAFEDEKIKK